MEDSIKPDPMLSNRVEKKSRVLGYDMARCLAILSMVYVNFEVVLAMGVPTPEILRQIATAFEGNASALFVTLAGIGMVLLRDRVILLRRALFLLVVGYLWQVIWPGDILHYYAFYLAVGVCVLPLRARWLWLLSIVVTFTWLLLAHYFNYGTGWQWMTLEYVDFWTLEGQFRNLFFNGWHPLFPWLAFLFVGMAFAKSDITTRKKRCWVLLTSVAVYAGAYFASAALSKIPDERPIGQQVARWFLAPDEIWGMTSLPPGPLYVISAAAVAIFIIVLCLEITSVKFLARCTKTLCYTGQLALTIYLAHVLVLYFVVYPMKESYSGSSLDLAAKASVAFGLGALIFSHLWRMKFSKGPLEWVMRKFTSRRRPRPVPEQ